MIDWQILSATGLHAQLRIYVSGLAVASTNSVLINTHLDEGKHIFSSL